MIRNETSPRHLIKPSKQITYDKDFAMVSNLKLVLKILRSNLNSYTFVIVFFLKKQCKNIYGTCGTFENTFHTTVKTRVR